MAVSVCLCGCAAKNIDVASLAADMVKDIKIEDELLKATDTVVKDLYGTIVDVEAITVYVSSSGATASELTVIKLKDKASVSGAKTAVEKRITSLQKNFENYVPSEMYRIKNAIIISKDRYLFFCIADNNEKMEKMFSDALK